MKALLQQRQEQDVAIDPGCFERDGGDAAVLEPGHQLAQPRGVSGELADGGVTVLGIHAHPVAGVADVNARRQTMLHGQGGQLGASRGLAPCGFRQLRSTPGRGADNLLAFAVALAGAGRAG